MGNKIRVYGKAQNRTALGIMHAYLTMYPHATLEDFQKAFPNSLNPDSGVKVNFIDVAEIAKTQNPNWSGFFTDEECLLKLQDGRKIAVVSMWTKSSFERLIDWAKQYDIEIAKFEAAEKGFGKKGGYKLEFLNGYIPPIPEKSKSKLWIWILLGLVILATLLFLLSTRGCQNTKVVTVVEKDTVTIVKVDTIYIKEFEDLEKQFNATQFALDSYELNEDAKFALHDLAKLMTEPTLKSKACFRCLFITKIISG